MNIPLYIINAFSSNTFGGNPAAVCPLGEWLSDEVMQAIAGQHNLSETAFFVPSRKPDIDFDIRWFTPTKEVDLCGHATMATSHVVFNELDFDKPNIAFDCRSGRLDISRSENTQIDMSFPLNQPKVLSAPESFEALFGARPIAAYAGTGAQPDLVLVFDNQAQVKSSQANLTAMKKLPYRCVIPTAKGDDVDFVCRVFAPSFGIDEDPVTGSAYTLLAPIWQQRFGATSFSAKQLSSRGGDVFCGISENRVSISGESVLYAKGQITLP